MTPTILRTTLALACLLSLAPARAAEPPPPPPPHTTATATAPTLEQLDALQSLRLSDPRAFIDAVHRLEQAAPPTDAATRDLLRLAGAQALALEARYDEALETALDLGQHAATPAMQVRAGALAVNIEVAARDFLGGQQRLDTLLADAARLGDVPLGRQVDIVAAVFYNQLDQHALAQRHAERVLAKDPSPTERCVATLQGLEAQLEGTPHRLEAAAFDDAAAQCRESGSHLPAGVIEVLQARWRTQRGDAEGAADGLQARMPAIIATDYPGLRAEAHAQLADSLQKSGRNDAALAETDAALALSASLPSGLPLLMARRTRYEIALARGDERRALLELQAVVAAERAYAEEIRRLQEDFQAGRSEALARQQSIALLEQRNEQLRLEALASDRTRTLLTLLLVPLGLAVTGVLVWAWTSRRDQRRHRHLLQVDPLTGLWTRAHFTQQAAAALGAAERLAQPMALVLFDLDHFSQVNSRHGHLAGDRLLAAVGRHLRDLETPGAHFGRLGGEEFALLLPRAGLDEGLAFAERCRAAIATTQALALDERTVIDATASFGVVSTTTAGYRLRNLLSNADHALYRAKGAGRNRVTAAVVVPVGQDAAA